MFGPTHPMLDCSPSVCAWHARPKMVDLRQLTSRLVVAVLLALSACAPKQADLADETDTGTGNGTHLSDGELSCDPLEQDCEPGMGCYVGDADAPFRCEPIGWGIVEGEPCTYPNDCLPGLVCLAGVLQPDCTEAIGCCVKFCDLNESLCPPGTACLPYFDSSPPPMYGNVGACLTP